MTIIDRDISSLLLGTLFGVLCGFPLAVIADPDFHTSDRAATHSAFKRLDRNRTGYLSSAEFRDGGGTAQAFREADANHDRRLDRHEFAVAQAIDQRIKTGEYFADAWITAKILARLVQENFPRGLNIRVKTVNGIVHLSGRLESAAQIRRVLDVTSRIDGVEGINNRLELKRRVD